MLEPSCCMRKGGQAGGIHTDGQTRRSKWSPFEFMQTPLKSLILISACNYIYLQNFIKLKLQCLIKLLCCSLHCCNKGFLITFGKPNFKQYSATSSNCNMSIHKIRTVDQIAYYYCCWSWTKTDMTI